MARLGGVGLGGLGVLPAAPGVPTVTFFDGVFVVLTTLKVLGPALTVEAGTAATVETGTAATVFSIWWLSLVGGASPEMMALIAEYEDALPAASTASASKGVANHDWQQWCERIAQTRETHTP